MSSVCPFTLIAYLIFGNTNIFYNAPATNKIIQILYYYKTYNIVS